MPEPPFRRVVVLCDAASDIRLAVAGAASLAARWGAALHGVFLDDENLHRFAALPFGGFVSLSSLEKTESFGAEHMARLSDALRSGMKRVLAEAAAAQGLRWSFDTIRNVPLAAELTAEEGDLLVIESSAREFSGTWAPRSAWEKSPAAFSGPVLRKRRGGQIDLILVLLPRSDDARTRVLAAAAAVISGAEQIVLAGEEPALTDAKAALAAQIDGRAPPEIRTLPLAEAQDALRRLLSGRAGSLIVLDASEVPRWLEDIEADVLFLR